MKRSSLPPQLLHNLKKQKKRWWLRVLACVDLGEGIFGELGGQGGSLRKSLSKRDLPSLPASDRQGGQGGKGTGQPRLPSTFGPPVPHRLPSHCRSLTYIQKKTLIILFHIHLSLYSFICMFLQPCIYLPQYIIR